MEMLLMATSTATVATVGTAMVLVGLLFSVGMCVLLVWCCKKIAESKGLSKHFMWLGLLGVIGIVIVAVIPGQQQYNGGYTSYGQQNQYGQPNQQGQNFYNQTGFYQQDTAQQGFSLNGQPVNDMKNVTVCTKCGATMSGLTDFCPFCGAKVR